jgi:hypothetical protein
MNLGSTRGCPVAANPILALAATRLTFTCFRDDYFHLGKSTHFHRRFLSKAVTVLPGECLQGSKRIHRNGREICS